MIAVNIADPINAKYLEAHAVKSVDDLVQLYADDATLIPPNHKALHGRHEIGHYYRVGLSDHVRAIDIAVKEFRNDDELAYQLGTVSWEHDGEPKEAMFVDVLTRQDDGNWKIQISIWNSATGIRF